jgi:tryptophan-rich hypothetical protein
VRRPSPERNPVNFKKLPGSKWTAIRPEKREKHFLVLGWEVDELGAPTDRVLMEAVLTRTVNPVPWRELYDVRRWRVGWC